MPLKTIIFLGLEFIFCFVVACFVINPRVRAWVNFHWHRIDRKLREANAPADERPPRFFPVDFGPDGCADEFRPDLNINHNGRFMSMSPEEAETYRRERLRHMQIAHDREDEATRQRLGVPDPATKKPLH